MPKKLLIVDDEPFIVKGLRFSLEQDGYETVSAYDGEEALRLFAAGGIDLVLLDVMLPKLSGIEVCQRLREQSDVPIIMLTAKGEDMDKILGLEYGADDYMTKPFNILEVKARIKSIFRRMNSMAAHEPDKNVIQIGKMQIYPANHSAKVNDRDISLTAKEYDLLQLLSSNRGRVYSRSQLLEMVWGSDYDGDERTVDVNIRRLREKVEEHPSDPEFIMTKWGVGYYFNDK